MVRCGFCQNEFDEDRGQPACMACPLGSDCGLVRCPLCAYENPSAPKWMDSLRSWFSARQGYATRDPLRLETRPSHTEADRGLALHALPMIRTRNPREPVR